MSTFLKGFEGYARRAPGEYKSAVRDYLVSVDTNVLLELYRFTPEARKEFLEVLKKLGDRLWVPHQVVREYYDRRVDAVKEHLDLYATVPEALAGHRNRTLEEINRFAKRCSLSAADRAKLTKPIEDAYQAVVSEVERRGKDFDLSLESMIGDDHVLVALAEILDGKTGDPFSDEDVMEVISAFDKRAAVKTPPGYRDASKEDNAHGDYFVWEQLLRHASANNTPVLFVTNDAKEDWVRKQSGFIVGARPELIKEFSDRCQEDFLLTQLGPFLRTAKEELGVAVSSSTVAQAENLQASHETTKYSMEEDLYQSVIEVLEKAQEGGSADRRNVTVSLLRDLKAQAVHHGSRVYVQIPRASTNELRAAIHRATHSSRNKRIVVDESNLEKKLERVRRRYGNAVADYERSCLALEKAAGTGEDDLVRDVLQSSRDEAAERLRVLSRRINELEEAIRQSHQGAAE